MASVASVQWMLRRQGLAGTVKFYALRFWSIRYVLTLAKRLIGSSPGQRTAAARRSLFGRHDVDRFLQKLRTESFCDGLQLPERHVASIRRFTEDTPAVTWLQNSKVEFALRDRKRVEQQYGKPIIIATHPGVSRNCDAVGELVRDPLLLEISHRYLGYEPRNIHARLFWSFACDAPVETRLKATQAIRFHYDATHFLHFNFYITSVDHLSGPHVLVRNSHGPKSFSELLVSTRRSDEFIEKKFGSDRIETLFGPAGFGFAEDQYCYHKATVPLEKDRLMLMIHVF